MLKKFFKKLKDTKAFTLIELLTVIAILGILVLIASPKFLGYAADAKLAQIKNDVKVAENSIMSELTENPKYTENWKSITVEEIKEHNEGDELYYKKGPVPDDYVFNEEYIQIPKKELSSKLPGSFIIDSDGDVFYHEDGFSVEDKPNEGGNSTEPPASSDKDGDGLTDKEENELGTDPNNPDTDGDGLNDKEDPDPLDPNNPGKDSDGDGVLDHLDPDPNDPNVPNDNRDSDGDGLTNKEEIELGTDFSKPDTDGDGINDKEEINLGTNPNNPDTDGDGLNDKEEIDLGTDPNNPDTDGDGTNDGQEVKDGTDPNDPDSSYYYATDDDFYLTNHNISSDYSVNGYNGYFRYVGKDAENIVIPDTIQGHKMTSYFGLFARSELKKTKKIISTNPNITSLKYMFFSSKIATIDLTELNATNVSDMSYMFDASTTYKANFFDTSKVKNMDGMFRSSVAVSLDVSTLNTSGATNLSNMFAGSQATSIVGLNKFNTSKVVAMRYMFNNASANELFLANFKLDSLVDGSGMFLGSKASTVWVNTQHTADYFSTLNKPSTLTFKVWL